MEMALKYNRKMELRQGFTQILFHDILSVLLDLIREEYIQLVKVLNCGEKNVDKKLIRAQLEFWVRQSECTSLLSGS